jgi:copper transport protein
MLAVVVAALVALVGGLWSAGPAAAHAELRAVTPADGELLDAAPSEVVLEWSESVSLTGGGARVLDDDAAVVSDPASVVGSTITIPLRGDLADGTYTVSWNVISADSHPISGATVFHVGVPSTTGPVDVGDAGGAGWGVRTGAAILTTLGYAGTLVGVGCWWFLLVAAPADGRLRRRLASLAERGAVLGAVALVASAPLRIARIGGGLGALRDDELLGESLTGPIGVSTLVTAVALLVLAGLTGRRGSSRALDALGAITGSVALVGFVLEGHTRSQQPRLLMELLDLVHLGAASLWLGGIAALVVAFRARPAPEVLERIVDRFSTLAVVSVLVVAGAGVGMAIIVLPTIGDLVDTGYGLALLTKTALVVPVVAMGAYNRRLVVAARSADEAPDEQASQAEPVQAQRRRRRLGRVVGAELVLLLAVVGVTSVLVTRSPIASSAPASAPPATVPADTVELPLSDGAGTALFHLAPGRAGQNQISLVLRDPEDQPLVPVDPPTVELTEPTIGIGPLLPIVHPLVAGEYHVIADIPLSGTYTMTVRVRVSDFAVATAETTVSID